MDPSHKDFDHYTVMWAEWLESIRKDVECVFGIVNQRFRWLRNKVPYHDIMLIYNAMRVAAILHNRLLIFDGYDQFDWEKCDPDSIEPEDPVGTTTDAETNASEGAVAANESEHGVLSQ